MIPRLLAVDVAREQLALAEGPPFLMRFLSFHRTHDLRAAHLDLHADARSRQPEPTSTDRWPDRRPT